MQLSETDVFGDDVGGSSPAMQLSETDVFGGSDVGGSSPAMQLPEADLFGGSDVGGSSDSEDSGLCDSSDSEELFQQMFEGDAHLTSLEFQKAMVAKLGWKIKDVKKFCVAQRDIVFANVGKNGKVTIPHIGVEIKTTTKPKLVVKAVAGKALMRAAAENNKKGKPQRRGAAVTSKSKNEAAAAKATSKSNNEETAKDADRRGAAQEAAT